LAARKNVEFALFTLKIFDDIVLKNPVYLELVTSDIYLHRTYSMGTVDSANRVNFYDGMIRVVDQEGAELVKYHPSDYMNQIAERVEPWTYLKFPYLKKVGWNGFTDGKESGVYSSTPLSRLNVADGMATPLAQEHFARFYEAFGGSRTNERFQPVHHRLATHWARLIELLYAAEHMLELASDPEISSADVRNIPNPADFRGVGIGSVEAPRGTLTHHYESDEKGVLTKVNMIVGTTNNYAPMTMSVKRVAEKLLNGGKTPDEGLLNRVEMAFRLYDPCLSCATHNLPGKMPLQLTIRDRNGAVVHTLARS
jgi:F420-non-reducing hydrogenase large subunit